MTLKDRIKAIHGSMNGYQDLKDKLREKRDELTLEKIEVSELRIELEICRQKYADSCEECNRVTKALDGTMRKLNASRTALFAFCPRLESTEQMKAFYDCIAPSLDADGFRLYMEAKELTGFQSYQAFPYEDIRGMFEYADGHEMMKYLLAYHFDAVEWNLVPGSSYESASLKPVDTATPEYQAFEHELYYETLCSLDFRSLLPERTVREQNKSEKKRGDDAR